MSSNNTLTPHKHSRNVSYNLPPQVLNFDDFPIDNNNNFNITLDEKKNNDSKSIQAKNELSYVPANFQLLSQNLNLTIQQHSISTKTANKNELSVHNIESIELTDLSLTDSNIINYHVLPINELIKQFNTNIDRGLNDDQILEKRAKYGLNKLSNPPRPSILYTIYKQLTSGFNVILWIASLLGFLAWKPIGDPPDITNLALAIVIIFVILLSSAFNYYQELKSHKIIASFTRMQPSYANVMRNNTEQKILSSELVPGDIVKISLGDKIPSDCRIIQCNGLQVNNSIITGESIPVHCTVEPSSLNYLESSNYVFYSSLVTSGTAIGIVCATGDNTVLGTIQNLTKTTHSSSEETLLHREIKRFVFAIVLMAGVTAVICLIGYFAWLNIKYKTYMPLASMITNLIGLVLAFVPTGLPIAVTLTLTYVAKKMYSQNCLVKNLSIVHTFNSVSIICSDKTGTITTGIMTVMDLFWGLHSHYTASLPLSLASCQNVDSDLQLLAAHKLNKNPQQHMTSPSKKLHKKQPSLTINTNKISLFKEMVIGACICSDAKLHLTTIDTQQPLPNNDHDQIDKKSNKANQKNTEHTELVGDAADIALYEFVSNNLNLSVESIRNQYPRIQSLPFHSKNKFMIVCTTNHNDNSSNNINNKVSNTYCTMKGAPEILLSRCSKYYTESGEEVDCDEDWISSIEQKQQELGSIGNRVIAIARKAIDLPVTKKNNGSNKVNNANDSNNSDEIELPTTGYTFLGILSLQDPPREGVASAVQRAQNAHIRIAMVSGDHATTALAISKQVNIVNPDSILDSFKVVQDQYGRAVLQLIRNNNIMRTHVPGIEANKELNNNLENAIANNNTTTIRNDKGKTSSPSKYTLASLFKSPKQEMQSPPTSDKRNQINNASKNPGDESVDDAMADVRFHMDIESGSNDQLSNDSDPQPNDLAQVVSIKEEHSEANNVSNSADVAEVQVQLSDQQLFNAEYEVCKTRQSTLKQLEDEEYIPAAIIVSGSDMALFDDIIWRWVLLHKEIVFARTSPEQKLKLVSEAQLLHEVIAMTGDGVNDAPALQRANLGIAMQQGAEVARESADIILLDNNFSSIIAAIEAGRLVNENLKKVILYLLPAGSFSETVPILVNIFLGIPLPLSPFLMIIICMLTDVIPAMALVIEKPEVNIMIRPPAKVNSSQARLVNGKLLLHAYFFIGLIETLCAFTCFFWYYSDHGFSASDILIAFDTYSDGYKGYTQAQLLEFMYTGQSIFFVALVIIQFFNLLVVRCRYVSGLYNNPFTANSRNLFIPVAMIISAVISIFVTQLPWINATFNTRPVPIQHVMPAIGFGAALFILDEIRKYYIRHHPQSFIAQLAW